MFSSALDCRKMLTVSSGELLLWRGCYERSTVSFSQANQHSKKRLQPSRTYYDQWTQPGLFPLQQTILQTSVQKSVLSNVARHLIWQRGDLKVLCSNETGLKTAQLRARNFGVLVTNRLNVHQQNLAPKSGSYSVSLQSNCQDLFIRSLFSFCLKPLS